MLCRQVQLLAGLACTCVVSAIHVGPLTGLQLLKQSSRQQLQSSSQDVNPRDLYPAHVLAVPVDHFQHDDKYAPHSNSTFDLRYWFDATYYRTGGPVIVLASGETSGENRLSFLQKGILHQLAKETNGIGVVLEHRFYGESMPAGDLSVDSLRFLDTQQALADYAYFAKHIRFPGLEGELLTSDWSSWIVYGGSYAGSFAAFLRTLYPNIFWGAISSSGVPAAIIDYWQYWEAVRLYAPANCVETTQDIMQLVDGILLGKKTKLKKQLKKILGLSHVSDDADFASAISMSGVGSWQGKVWDATIGDPTFAQYCKTITSKRLSVPAAPHVSGKKVKKLQKNIRKLIKKEGSLKPTKSLVTSIANFIAFVDEHVVQACRNGGLDQDQCLSTHNEDFWQQSDLAQSAWRSWTWQYCTQWGYFQTGSGIPSHIRPIVPRALDMDYMTRPCRLAFGLKSPVVPDIASINQYGAFDIAYPRLAFIDGQADPWRWAGVHAPAAARRTDWVTQPFVQIRGAVHHWDEYGLFRNETHNGSIPAQVAQAQEYERAFVKMWVDEWRWRCRWRGSCDGTRAQEQHLRQGYEPGQVAFEEHDRL